jgi:hypothetical protein
MIDGGGDAFILLTPVSDTASDQYGGLWFANISVGGFTTITFKISTLVASGFSTFIVLEVSGLSASASDTGTSSVTNPGSAATNGDSTGSFTLSQTGELVIGCFFEDTSASALSWTAGTSPIAFTIPVNGSTSLGGSNPHAVEYAVWSGSGAINPAITLGNAAGYIAIGWGFKAASAAAFGFEESSPSFVFVQ